jgi:DNA-binding transcriptional regulator LsrR (DeoR family)
MHSTKKQNLKNEEFKKFQMAQIAFLYYDKGMTQQEIANKFNLSKMKVSRFLEQAKELEIVQISVNPFFQLNEKLQNQIQRKYDIEKAIIVKHPKSKAYDISTLLGQVWAFYMGISLPDNYVLGLGVGNTIGQVVKNLAPMQTKNLHIVQLMGGLADVNERNPFTIVQEICRKLKAKGTHLTSFAAVENKELRNSIIYKSSMGQQIRGMWEKCKQALFGIGAIEKGTLLSPKLVSSEELQKLKQLGAVGDTLGHCFDQDGNFIHTNLEERLVSIPVNMLKNIQDRVVIAGGEYKVQAIRGLLRSGLITTLVTDETAAKKIMES